MAVVGAELSEMDRLARCFGEHGTQLGATRGQIDSVLAATTWTGPAAQKFRSEWAQFAPTLGRLQESLADAGRAVQQRRAAIEAATS